MLVPFIVLEYGTPGFGKWQRKSSEMSQASPGMECQQENWLDRSRGHIT